MKLVMNIEYFYVYVYMYGKDSNKVFSVRKHALVTLLSHGRGGDIVVKLIIVKSIL